MAISQPVAMVVGANQFSEGCGKKENAATKKPVRNTASTRTAKLKRDYPEVAERMAKGEFKNVRDAERIFVAGLLWGVDELYEKLYGWMELPEPTTKRP